MGKTYLMTGGNGFLGSRLSCELIKRGDRIIFLGRSKSEISFKQRLVKSLFQISSDVIGYNFVVFETDQSKKYLGLKEEELDFIKSNKIDGLWNLSANLSFDDKDKDNVFFTNNKCLENILELVNHLNIPLYHISTAYVSGRKNGLILEKILEYPPVFNNHYEESKFKAEKLILNNIKDNGFVIFRPSILIDPLNKTLNSFGYYTILQSLYKFKKNINFSKISIPFPCAKKTALNLMPVDIAVLLMIEISLKKESKNKIFHLTNPNPLPTSDLIRKTFGAFEINVFTFNLFPSIIRGVLWFFYKLSLINKSTFHLMKRLYGFRYYITTMSIYSVGNVELILGKKVRDFFEFKSSYYDEVIISYIRRMDNYHESLHSKK